MCLPSCRWRLLVGLVSVFFKAIWGYGYVTERAKKLRRRAGGAFQVVIFVVLAVLAGAAAAGAGPGSSGKASATVGVFGLPGGPYIVGAVGIGIPAVGIVKIVRGCQKKSIDKMDHPPDRCARASSPCAWARSGRSPGAPRSG
jgi:Domain of Unknown Function (DUF1206)